MTVSLLFIAGVPASGKSHFGRWLAQNRSFVHVDAELPGQLEQAGLRDLWNQATSSLEFSALAATLRERGSSLVLNWGFPPSCLPIAAAIQRAGFASWWFDADILAARKTYIADGRPVEWFDN